jgi:hypothetical protein
VVMLCGLEKWNNFHVAGPSQPIQESLVSHQKLPLMYHGCIKNVVPPCDTIKYTLGVHVFVSYSDGQELSMQHSDYKQTNVPIVQ